MKQLNLDDRISLCYLSGMRIWKAKRTDTPSEAPNGNQWFRPDGGELWFFDVGTEPIKQLIRDVLEEVHGSIELEQAACRKAGVEVDPNFYLMAVPAKAKELGL